MNLCFVGNWYSEWRMLSQLAELIGTTQPPAYFKKDRKKKSNFIFLFLFSKYLHFAYVCATVLWCVHYTAKIQPTSHEDVDHHLDSSSGSMRCTLSVRRGERSIPIDSTHGCPAALKSLE